LRGKPLEAHKRYKVAGWAPVAAAASPGEPVWEVIIRYFRDRKTLPPLKANEPRLLGVKGNPGREQ
jgi:sulfur-oxidizing protein SoxB